ncbi:MAG: FkbM family methyltransferase, partial [Vulcanisaeta sp.]|nr:FkbM family methyltransferase [Vulcanisaeta sp.]
DPNDAVLKMDCEGCEFDIILNDYEHVKLFKELILEYHGDVVNKTVNDLLNMLSKDYRCNVIRGNKVSGNMHCIRK